MLANKIWLIDWLFIKLWDDFNLYSCVGPRVLRILFVVLGRKRYCVPLLQGVTFCRALYIRSQCTLHTANVLSLHNNADLSPCVYIGTVTSSGRTIVNCAQNLLRRRLTKYRPGLARTRLFAMISQSASQHSTHNHDVNRALLDRREWLADNELIMVYNVARKSLPHRL